uniref:Uncharacterized protein n=1 Tax=Arundo donax TaxID=35708 RepID=A0A0A9HRW5_ARUDO
MWRAHQHKSNDIQVQKKKRKTIQSTYAAMPTRQKLSIDILC